MVRKTDGQRSDIYTRITDRIIEELAQGVRPWMQPWNTANTDGRITRPLRHNGQPYSGMNVLLLWSEQKSRGFASSMWMTFKQALELGASVRKGETGSTVVFASRFTKSEADGNGGEVDREIPSSRPIPYSISSRSIGFRITIILCRHQFRILSSGSRRPIFSSATPARSSAMVAARHFMLQAQT